MYIYNSVINLTITTNQLTNTIILISNSISITLVSGTLLHIHSLHT